MSSVALNQSKSKVHYYNVVFEFCKRDSFPHDVAFSVYDGFYKTISSIEKRRQLLESLNTNYYITVIISANG
jgi:hypothetical protein